MGILDDFDNPSLATTTFRLPVFYHRLFAAQSSCAPNPKDTCSEVSVRRRVVEYQSCFRFELVADTVPRGASIFNV
jgi:hypothetical protein